MSRRTAFSLACAVVISALVPGVAGYLSARMEAIEAAELRLQSIRIRLQRGTDDQARALSFPRPCTLGAPGETVFPFVEPSKRTASTPGGRGRVNPDRS